MLKLLSAVPLLIAISLVYAASRHEDWRAIWIGSVRTFAGFGGLLAAVFLVLLVLHLWLA